MTALTIITFMSISTTHYSHYSPSGHANNARHNLHETADFHGHLETLQRAGCRGRAELFHSALLLDETETFLDCHGIRQF